MQPPDETLVTASCHGDFAAFGQLYERYYSMAVGIARARLSEIHLSEDAAQESFAEAFRSLKSLQDGKRFGQWLGTICRRKASQLAQQQRPQNLLDAADAVVGPDANPRLRIEVQEALRQLDEDAREIVVLHYFSGMSYEEIARVLDLTPASIHGQLQRARRKLASLLSPQEASTQKTFGVKS